MIGYVYNFAFIICVLFTMSQRLKAQHEITVPEEKELSLAGVLKQVHGYGPPGFGESRREDVKITYWVLEVKTPITVPCIPEKPEWASVDCQSAKQIRLFFPLSPEGDHLKKMAIAFRNKQMLLTGVLHRQDTAGEITPVYMNVTDIQSIKKNKPTTIEDAPPVHPII